MYEDAWISGIVPEHHREPEKPRAAAHRRRVSLLKQPNESNQADVDPVEAIPDIVEEPELDNGPPQATVARRAKSFSDFYDVARAHLKKERDLEKLKLKKRSRDQLRTELDFGDWYNGISDELLDASHEEYQLYRDQLHLSQRHLDSLLESTSSALDLLSALSDSFKSVSAQTTTFQSQCEGLIADQKRVTKLADDISENLQYYTYLEPTTRRLNAPGATNFVRADGFTDMLLNLDSCIDYMMAHPNHSESATYRSRYRLLLTRALSLIRVHFTNTLREIAADVSKRIADRQLNDTTMSALLYAKFRVGAAELKELGLEIQKRAVLPADADPDSEPEYQSLMNELYQSYSATRGRLILPLIAKKMAEISLAPSSANDLVTFARSSISYIRGICFDEYGLWEEWFVGEGGVYDFLESIMEPFYDYLRPRTIHETQLVKLCELCTLIQTRYMEEEEEEYEPVESVRLKFADLILPALEDAQTRLVFLTLSILRDEIEYYKPKPEDLDYHSRNRKPSEADQTGPVLSGKKTTNGPMMIPAGLEDEDGDSRWAFNAEAAFRDWYPTLRKAIWLLSKIYRLVNSTVFDDLAHQIVHQTTLSLYAAAAQIASRHSPTDSQLFLIKHLLLLKQQIVAFDIEFVAQDVSLDFSSVTSTFYELRDRGALFNPANLVRGLVAGSLLPRVVENMLDAKAELDGRLRTVINDFTSAFAGRVTAPLSKAAKTTTKKGKFGGGGIGDGEQKAALAAVAEVRASVEREVAFLRGKLDAFVDDLRTRETLVVAVVEQVVANYEAFWERLVAEEDGGGGGQKQGAAAAKGKARADEVWEPGVFAEWCAGVFRVGQFGLGAQLEGANADAGVGAEEGEEVQQGVGDDEEEGSVTST
ncbi:golgi complex component cog3 [Diplodia corticola]|uniref:Conserved oligomeric Golgi complex subunit 3 n=1 Tax=Diplodia corticola TaxID=236234 RepID=A0A1J9QZV6_9PEZI|nr:golgi complex component cog3 [Diplodia corticola]OJD34630.1 golgi complex component cog3 [Diplodia corticola]